MNQVILDLDNFCLQKDAVVSEFKYLIDIIKIKMNANPKPLADVLKFSYPPLVERMENKGFSKREARELIEDVFRFLWLCAAKPNNIFVPTAAIDRGWHEFLQFTQAYHDFCETKLHSFIHHVPREAFSNGLDKSIRCSACARGINGKINIPHGISLRKQTKESAKSIFGKLSKNWKH